MNTTSKTTPIVFTYFRHYQFVIDQIGRARSPCALRPLLRGSSATTSAGVDVDFSLPQSITPPLPPPASVRPGCPEPSCYRFATQPRCMGRKSLRRKGFGQMRSSMNDERTRRPQMPSDEALTMADASPMPADLGRSRFLLQSCYSLATSLLDGSPRPRGAPATRVHVQVVAHVQDLHRLQHGSTS